jgi:threonine 3-dehydrogenase
VQALQFVFSIPRYIIGRALGPFYAPTYYSGLSCVRFRQIAEPRLLGPDWVRIRTHYGGICGSDLRGMVQLRMSPQLTPFGSYPFTMGHEQVGTIAELGEAVGDFAPGQRVVVDPVLSCPVRGIEPQCPACQAGEWSRCRSFAEGSLSPGVMLGSCADTGGSWSSSFLAHRFQLFALPASITDENALLIEPFTTALHAVARSYPSDSDTVLVVGAGVIGICVIAALRCLGSRAQVVVLAKYPYQGELAVVYGADRVILIDGTDHYESVAEATGGRLHTPMLGKRTMMGGASVVYECVGSDSSLDDALRFVRAGGRLALLGTSGRTTHVDWTPLWFQELSVASTNCASAMEYHEGESLRTFDWAIRWMSEGQLDLSQLLTHRFALSDYRQAFEVAMNKRWSQAVKVAFTFS